MTCGGRGKGRDMTVGHEMNIKIFNVGVVFLYIK